MLLKRAALILLKKEREREKKCEFKIIRLFLVKTSSFLLRVIFNPFHDHEKHLEIFSIPIILTIFLFIMRHKNLT